MISIFKVHCGWLTKQGGLLRISRRRWFEIRGDLLYYHREDGVSNCVHIIVLI